MKYKEEDIVYYKGEVIKIIGCFNDMYLCSVGDLSDIENFKYYYLLIDILDKNSILYNHHLRKEKFKKLIY